MEKSMTRKIIPMATTSLALPAAAANDNFDIVLNHSSNCSLIAGDRRHVQCSFGDFFFFGMIEETLSMLRLVNCQAI